MNDTELILVLERCHPLAANHTSPSRPTMSVSAREINIWLISPAASGSARATVNRPSRFETFKDAVGCERLHGWRESG